MKLHPALLLFVLTIIIMIVSSVGSILNLETTYYNVNPVSGDLETKIVTINVSSEIEFSNTSFAASILCSVDLMILPFKFMLIPPNY